MNLDIDSTINYTELLKNSTTHIKYSAIIQGIPLYGYVTMEVKYLNIVDKNIY